jgi:hypothetical protein
VKNNKIANNLTATKATEKISADLESVEFKIFFDEDLTKFKNSKNLLHKISHVTTGRKIPIENYH